MNKGIKIIIQGDTVPTSSNYSLFKSGNIEELVGKELSDYIKNADFIIGNLETPLVDFESPINKCGPCLSAPTYTIKGLKAINGKYFCLANNHIMDQGENGLVSTLKVLENNGIRYGGVGKNENEANKGDVVEVKGYKIGIYCCAEHEFSIATSDRMGANGYDPLICFDIVKDMKEKVDYLIVLFHGGKEHYRYPTPNLQKILRKFASTGADLVIAQHSHCIGCEEKYRSSRIVYGQGNFIFDYNESEYWKTSLMIQVEIDGLSKNIRYIPVVKDNNSIRQAYENESKMILNSFKRRTEEIMDESIVEKKFIEYISKKEHEYLMRISNKSMRGFIFRLINKCTKYTYIKKKFDLKARLNITNVIECETHREIISRIMQESIK